MRSSKDRTIEKKRRHKATTSRRTEESRARRISNKHKRQEIHNIDPNLKVFIMDERIYDVHGVEIEVVDGKIKPVLINGIYKLTDKSEVIDNDVVIDKIKIKNRSALERLTDRFKKNKLEL